MAWPLASPPRPRGRTASLGFLTLGGPVPRRRCPSPRRASSAPLPSSRLPPPRSPGPGKLASVVTITNSIVLSRAPANKVIHYGPLPAAVGCAAISGPPAAPSRAETRVRAITCRRRGRHAVPRGPAAPRRRGERRPAISFISERQLTYTDWLPAAKCQLNCKCLAEPGRECRLFPEGAVRSRLLAPCSI